MEELFNKLPEAVKERLIGYMRKARYFAQDYYKWNCEWARINAYCRALEDLGLIPESQTLNLVDYLDGMEV